MNTIINHAKTIAILIAIVVVNIFYWLPLVLISTIIAKKPINGSEILPIGILIELLIGIMCIIYARNAMNKIA